MNKSIGVAVLALTLTLTLTSCGVPRPRPRPAPPHGAPQPAAPLRLPASTAVYRIDSDQSELRLLVYRAGPLGRFGHNHVVVNHAISGQVDFAGTAGASTFSLTVPAAGFVVDDAQARREEGSDFPSDIPDDAKAGTLHNMLSAAVLDAAEFPDITVSGAAVAGAMGPGGLIATVTISIAGHVSRIDLPFTLAGDSSRLSAGGTVELRQTAIGLTPYSLMLGALRVQDAMTLKFKIVALRG